MREMDLESSEEMYIIKQAQGLRPFDMHASKSWIITAKTLFPSNFHVQFESYKIEKDADNYAKAAKYFSYIVVTLQNQNMELWNEVNELTNALRAPENEITPTQQFYVKMFKHVSYDVQQRILLITVTHTENILEQCKLMILVLKKFPKASLTHMPKLLEMISDNMKEHSQDYQELLVKEVLPMIEQKTPELPPLVVCRIFTICLEYYIRQIIDEESKTDTNEIWKQIFKVLMFCGKIQHWETFLPFNKSWGQNVYWDKLIEIVSTSPAGSTQVLFYATTLFIYSLHCYIKNCNTRPDEVELNHILVEGFSEWKLERADTHGMEPPQISLTTAASKEISKAFAHAAQCWQLLNTEQFQRDFSKLLLTLPLAGWISRFLFDLAIYFGHQEEAKKLMTEMTVKSNLVHNIQVLSLNLLQGSLSLQGFECVLKILGELPTSQGEELEHLTLNVPRHMIFIPLTQKALIQYCAKAIVTHYSRKLYESNCPDQTLGDLLVLLQLEYPRETALAEQIFALITSRTSFTYRLLPAYIITIDFIEEFMHIWHTRNENFTFDFSSSQTTGNLAARRIGTRGVDKGVRDDFRSIMKSQVLRANENVTAVVANFITQEHLRLLEIIYGVDPSNYPVRVG